MKKYRIDVFIVDDHRLFSEGLADVISHRDDMYVSRTFVTLAECRQMLPEHRPDVLLLDISMSDGDGIEFCRQVLTDFPRVRIVAVTVHDEYAVIRRMMESGAHGYVLKSASMQELTEAIVAVWKGEQYVSAEVEAILRKGESESVVLTEAEKNILNLICAGLTNPEIAAQLGLSTETVNWYRKRLLTKFDVRNTVSLVRIAMKEKLI